MKLDSASVLDDMVADQIDTTVLRVVPTATSGAVGDKTDSVTLTTNGTATNTNNVAMGKDHIKAIVDVMKERSEYCSALH